MPGPVALPHARIRSGGQDGGTVADTADDVALADTPWVEPPYVVLNRLPPREGVTFVLHDSFRFDLPSIAAVLDTTPVAARKLASRARARVAQPHREDRLADWEVVGAFMAAAKKGRLRAIAPSARPNATVTADERQSLLDTQGQINGGHEVATFFNGSARAALPVFRR